MIDIGFLKKNVFKCFVTQPDGKWQNDYLSIIICSKYTSNLLQVCFDIFKNASFLIGAMFIKLPFNT